MSSQHSLSLDVPTILNNCVLRVVDTSVYSADLDVTCETLQITPPGFTTASFEVTRDFSANITACDLNIQTSGCDVSYGIVPDGIYVIRYSVAPNEYVYVEYNHLRTTEILNHYREALCNIEKLGGCEPTEEIERKLHKLSYIRTLIDAAKAKVEVCHEPEKGMSIYEYAKKELNKLTCTNC